MTQQDSLPNRTNEKASTTILRIALPVPLLQTFDYLPPHVTTHERLHVGVRLRVPFGRGHQIGILVDIVQSSKLPITSLKSASEIIDDEPVLEESMLALLRWASHYYHTPLGETLMTALPAALRRGDPVRIKGETIWRLTAAGAQADKRLLGRAKRQAMLLDLLRSNAQGVGRATLRAAMPHWRPPLRALLMRGWAEASEAPLPRPARQAVCKPSTPPRLTVEQAEAVAGLRTDLGHFQTSLLYGITGSGKTEVYLRLIADVVAAGRQALVLVPEIGLTPQLLERFHARLDCPIVCLHSAMGQRERLTAWQQARSGMATIVIGTRSAIFTPLPQLGLIVLDEEHDPSYKQQDGLRYHARDLAIMRARSENCPIVLGSATPSLETLHNVATGRYRNYRLSSRTGRAGLPVVRLIDIRAQPLDHGLSRVALDAIHAQLDGGHQVLIFLNRRGYASTIVCHSCGWIASCPRCDARLVLHRQDNRLRCHHCGHTRPPPAHCPDCKEPRLRELGQGTERIESVLERRFPDREILRIDRDTTRRKGELDEILARIRDDRPQILIGTQLLAKGHHFPGVTLAVVVDADQGLYGSDFRASERMGQLILQVAGRAGRADHPSAVMLQTYHPDHPLFTPLLAHDYSGFAKTLLREREAAELPPFSHQILFRAEATAPTKPLAVLNHIAERARALAPADILVLGPIPATMERRAGRYRAQLLLQSRQRRQLHELLDILLPWIQGERQPRSVRWSVDVDPIDFY